MGKLLEILREAETKGSPLNTQMMDYLQQDLAFQALQKMVDGANERIAAQQVKLDDVERQLSEERAAHATTAGSLTAERQLVAELRSQVSASPTDEIAKLTAAVTNLAGRDAPATESPALAAAIESLQQQVAELAARPAPEMPEITLPATPAPAQIPSFVIESPEYGGPQNRIIRVKVRPERVN